MASTVNTVAALPARYNGLIHPDRLLLEVRVQVEEVCLLITVLEKIFARIVHLATKRKLDNPL